MRVEGWPLRPAFQDARQEVQALVRRGGIAGLGGEDRLHVEGAEEGVLRSLHRGRLRRRRRGNKKRFFGRSVPDFLLYTTLQQ